MAEKPRKPGKRKATGKKPGAPIRNAGGKRVVQRHYPPRSNAKRSSPQVSGFRQGLIRLVVRLGLVSIFVIGLMLLYFATTLPDIRSIDTIKKQQGITIATEDGHVIANYGDVYGKYIPYEQIPHSLVQAVIATEDRRFFAHHGVDFWGIARAMVTNARAGRVVQGGSTVTQQVAKNVFLSPERSLRRKVQELLLAFWLEGRFTKKEIMAIYLNRVYLGGGAYGVDAAAHRYFNKSATELNLYESAMMAGLLKAPSRYAPSANLVRSHDRVHQVLLNMVDAGFLKKAAVQPTLDNYTKSPARDVSGGDARYFSDWIVDEIPNLIGQVNEDLLVTTTMDSKLQALASDTLQNDVTTMGHDKNVTQGALVAMTPDGAVKAIVGGLNYADSQYNRAVQAKRQPGSSFKLFVYLAALEAGYSPQTIVTDGPISMQVGNKVWNPANYDSSKGYMGDITMVEALRNSLNTVSVRLTLSVGPDKVAAVAEKLGVPDVPAYPSIALGSVEATLLEMVGAYAHLPNRGARVVPHGILSIRTTKGKELYQYQPAAAEQVLSESTVKQMNYMLQDVVQRGTGTKAAVAGHPAAGKTGTSQDYKDAWFVGFTPQLVTGVWVGNDDNKSMKKITGGTIPAPIWHDFMTKALEGLPGEPIPTDAGSAGGGLFPWLFGNGSGNNDGEAPDNGRSDDGEFHPTRLFETPPGGEAAPQPQPSPQPQETPPRGENGDVLTPEFWNKLAKEAPKRIREQPVEYKYPGQGR